MLVYPPHVLTNAERQRMFVQRNPGYYQRLRARRRASMQATAEQSPAPAQPAAATADPASTGARESFS